MPADGEVLSRAIPGRRRGPQNDRRDIRGLTARIFAFLRGGHPSEESLEEVQRYRGGSGYQLRCQQGEIFGLVGPDGAGKTSTFQILAGVMEASSGAADVLGRPARQMRSQSGYLSQGFTLYPDLSVAENIRYVGALRGIDPREIDRRSQSYLEKFDMLRFRDRLAGRLSGGMKQKLALVCALVPEPGVLLLDEPTTGVDPVSRREFWDALAHLAAEG